MNSLVNYFIEANAGFIFFYLIYYLLLRNETDFRRQRLFLLAGLVSSLVFPFIHVKAGIAQPVLQNEAIVSLPELIINNMPSSVSIVEMLTIAYLVGVAAIATPLLLHVIRLYRVSRSPGTYKRNYFIIESNSNNPSWSFFRVIFIGRSNHLTPGEKELIVKHEMLHGRLFHSADILLITIVCLVCWFNPVLWIYRRTLARVHEFEVDSIVATEINPAEYGILLAKTVLSGNGLLLAHHFNQSFILKRINMLNAMKGKISRWKIAGLITCIALYFVAISCTEQLSDPPNPEGEIFTIVDDTAMPIGGIEAYYAQLAKELQYPGEAISKGVQGKVFVEFVVRADGRVTDFKILKGISPACDNEAVRILAKMGKWQPGKMKGQPVNQKMVLPITFKLN